VEISRELQEARDSEAEARMLRRQRVQMFRKFSARIMEVAHHLGIHGLNLPTVPEDDGSIILFFSQLAEQLDGASAKVLEIVDAECRELLGLAGTRIFSNLQCLRPTLTWRKSCRGECHHRPALLTARRRPGRPGWTSPYNDCRPFTPAPEHPQPRARRAPPAATPQAPGSPAAKEPGETTTERRSPAERRPQVLAKAPAMTRMMQRPPSKLFPRPPPKEMY
jgi:hypothetical protein